MHKELRLVIIYTNNGVNVTAQGWDYENEEKHSVIVGDVEIDDAILGNKKLMKALKKIMNV
jgi:hypothetical protein